MTKASLLKMLVCGWMALGLTACDSTFSIPENKSSRLTVPTVSPVPPEPSVVIESLGPFTLKAVQGNVPSSVNSLVQGNLTLLMQYEGNLVLYSNFGKPDRKVLWASSTTGPLGINCLGDCHMAFQPEGNLVLYFGQKLAYAYSSPQSLSGVQLRLSSVAPHLQLVQNQTKVVWSSATELQQVRSNDLAKQGLADLIKNCWVGDSVSGNFQCAGPWPVGLPNAAFNLNYGQPQMLTDAFYSYASFTGDKTSLDRLKSSWSFLKSKHTLAELSACGEGTLNPRLDDANWSILMYLGYYNTQPTPEKLKAATDLIDCVTTPRWLDNTYGGGAWYSDGFLRTTPGPNGEIFNGKTYVNAVMAVNAWDIYERTGNEHYLRLSQSLFVWAKEKLRRPDGIFWWYFGPGQCPSGLAVCPGGTDSTRDPRYDSQITTGYGDAGLTADMAISLIAAREYRRGGQVDDSLRLLAVENTAAVLRRLIDAKLQIFVNAGDASGSNTLIVPWMREVLSLPGAPREQALMLIRRTALSIVARARTAEGYYGGSWDGPARGGYWDTVQGGTFVPENISVSANSVLMLIAAAATDLL